LWSWSSRAKEHGVRNVVDEQLISKCAVGIDMVGCHKGVVEDCYFRGEKGCDNSEAIQMKGGCTDNLVQCCNHVVQNTIVLPDKWIGRILQETHAPQFMPCRDGVFAKNVVVFDRRVGRPEFINVGPGTAPETWRFTGNEWFDTDGNRKSRLPGTETGSVHQVDPKLVNIGKPTMRITSADERLKPVGAVRGAYNGRSRISCR
jgi:hypothetical protein